jgi:hypothetical protein
LLLCVFDITVVLIRAYHMRAVGLKGTVMENVLAVFAYVTATVDTPTGITEQPVIIMDRGSAILMAIAFVFIFLALMLLYAASRRGKD